MGGSAFSFLLSAPWGCPPWALSLGSTGAATPPRAPPRGRCPPHTLPSLPARPIWGHRLVMAVDPLHLQVFNELDQAGSLLAKETLEDGLPAHDGLPGHGRLPTQDGLPVHDGKGDLRKCPYYAAQLDKGRPRVFCAPGTGVLAPTHGMSPRCCCTGALEGSSCPFGAALAVLRRPGLQFLLAASVALAAGLLAWYSM